MSIFNRYRWPILGVVAILLIIFAISFTKHGIPGPVPDTTTFTSGNFSFTYPRTYEAKEYSSGQVSVGEDYQNAGFIPLVDVVRYKQDPQGAVPASFTAFMTKQVTAICGTDGGSVSISCSKPVITPFTTAAGREAEEVMLTLNKKNLSTGTTSASVYGPIYVFETTLGATKDSPINYQGVFVFPTFSSFILVGTTSPAFVESIASSVTITGK